MAIKRFSFDISATQPDFLTESIVYFLNTVHCYNILEEYYYYEIQMHKALCDFAVEKGYCWLKEGLPPRHIRE